MRCWYHLLDLSRFVLIHHTHRHQTVLKQHTNPHELLLKVSHRHTDPHFAFPQIKDILKGALRFNQSQLEAEENEEITIADDHYCSTGQDMVQQDGSTTTANTDTEMVQPSPRLDFRHLSVQEKEMTTREKTTMPSEGAHTTEPQVREDYTCSSHTHTPWLQFKIAWIEEVLHKRKIK